MILSNPSILDVVFNHSGILPYQVKLIGGSVEMVEWFRRDNTEGYSEEILKVMNEKMQKQYDSLTDEEKENESYIDYLKEQILISH
jgi:hypothetical protein